MKHLVLIALALYLFGLGLISGVAVERWRFDVQRAVLLRQFDEAVRRQHEILMDLEKMGACQPRSIKRHVNNRWAWRSCPTLQEDAA